MSRTLIQVVAATTAAVATVAFFATAGMAHAAASTSTKVEHLPRVVVTGKATAASQVVQLPRVVIVGRSLVSTAATMALNTATRSTRRV